MADRTFLQSYVVSGASAYRSFRLIESAYDPETEQDDTSISRESLATQAPRRRRGGLETRRHDRCGRQ